MIIDMRRSQFISNIFALLNDGVITPEDLNEFSDELKEIVKMYVEYRRDTYEK